MGFHEPFKQPRDHAVELFAALGACEHLVDRRGETRRVRTASEPTASRLIPELAEVRLAPELRPVVVSSNTVVPCQSWPSSPSVSRYRSTCS
jgi:hypothetical protein